jgi:hypothetical protein
MAGVSLLDLRRLDVRRIPPGRRRWGAVAAIVAVVLVGLVAAVGVWTVLAPDGPGDGDASARGTTSTSMVTGGIEVPTPEGWRAIPIPRLGFGVAIPSDWEATVLDDEVLADLSGSSPAVPGFVEAAHAARQSGSVLYGAGVDAEERVTDLKVRIVPEPEPVVTDVAGLEAYARQLAAESGVADPSFSVVEGAAAPTVDVRYSLTAQRPGEAEGDAPVEVAVQATERVVLGPSGAVYSLIVTSEDAPDHDALATQLFDTLTFAPA